MSAEEGMAPLRTPAGLAMEPATERDVDALVELRDRLARWMVERGIEQWRPGEFPRERMSRWVDGNEVFVHHRDGALAAAVVVLWSDADLWKADDATSGYLHLLMVDRRHRGQQIGEELLAWAEQHIAGHGRALARLDAVSQNRWLQAWYEARGYREVGERSFEHGGWFPVTLREKPLRRRR